MVLFSFFCLVILVILFGNPSIDNFDPLSHYKELLIPATTKKQRYLSFLDDLNVNYKNKLPQTGPYRGTCDDKLNQVLQNKSLQEVFDNQINDNNLQDEFKRDPCIAVSSYLCQFTDPMMYLSESRMPPRWAMRSLKDEPLPYHVDISCFNKTYNCCTAKTK